MDRDTWEMEDKKCDGKTLGRGDGNCCFLMYVCDEC
jgi:hypothetical protein